MTSKKAPKKRGLYWTTLDNGNGEIEIALIRVRYYEGLTSFDQGVLCEFVDGSDRNFEMKDISQEIVQPWKTVRFGTEGMSKFEQVKITWHGQAKPPASARNQKPV